MICSICLEENANHKLLNCDHYFHKKCIDEWVKIKPICPLCRTPCITNFTYYYIPSRVLFFMIRKGNIIISKECITITKLLSFKSCNKPTIVNFSDIKRIEHKKKFFRITYFNNSIYKTISLYSNCPEKIFNICKYHLMNNRLIRT